MSTIAVRLNSTGNLYASTTASVEFDEVTQSAISVSSSKVYANVFDEVTGTDSGRAMQQLKTGTLRVAGVFDEVSGIS